MPRQPKEFNEDELLEFLSKAAEEDSRTVEIDPTVSVGEENWWEFQKLQYEVDQLEQQISHSGQIHKARIVGLLALFLLVVVWLGLILYFVYQSGKVECPPIELSDSVLIALISSTTLNVLGLFLVAAKWLYGNNDPKPTSKKSKSKKAKK